MAAGLAAVVVAGPAEAQAVDELVWSADVKLTGRPNHVHWARGRILAAFSATEERCFRPLDQTPPKHMKRLWLDVVLVAGAGGRLRAEPARLEIMPSVRQCLLEEIAGSLHGLGVERVALRLRPGKKREPTIEFDFVEVPLLEVPAFEPGAHPLPPREVLAVSSTRGLPNLVDLSFPCTHAHLRDKPSEALRVMRNEVFARHGRAFKSKGLQAHFGETSWYRVRADYDDTHLSDDDRECVRRISVFEHVWRTVFRGEADIDSDGKREPVTFLIREMAPPPGAPVSFVRSGWPPADYTLDGLLLIGDATMEVPIAYGHQTPQSDAWTPLALVDQYGVRAGVGAVKGASNPVLWVELGGDDYLGPPQRTTLVRAVDDGLEVYRDVRWVGLKDRLLFHDFDDTCSSGHDVFYAYAASGLVVDHTEYREPANSYCAACPFVEVESGGAFEPRGEILRHLVGESAEAWQALALGTVATEGQQVRVRLVEKKQELTFVRDLRLAVPGQRLTPTACALNATAVPCPAGKEATRLAPADELVVVFPHPGRESGGPLDRADALTLEARGYYQPLPSARGVDLSAP